MLRGWGSDPAYEIMHLLSPVTKSVGLYHHPKNSVMGAQRVVSRGSSCLGNRLPSVLS